MLLTDAFESIEPAPTGVCLQKVDLCEPSAASKGDGHVQIDELV